MSKIGKPLSVEEKKGLFLEIMDDVDAYCREQNIRYSLAYGSLIGAIRHHGFIPWDDDLDIMMPLPDMLRFKNEFKSDKLSYFDVDTLYNYPFAFSSIADLRTYRKSGLIDRTFGVSIDVYPVVGICDNKDGQQLFFESIKSIGKHRWAFLQLRNRITRALPLSNIPGFRYWTRRYRDIINYSFPYGETNSYFINSGSIAETEIIDYDIFEHLINIEFEGREYLCSAYYDKFLTAYYGNYMEFPPESERHPYHTSNCYWK